jgi:superfamily II helicase
MTKNKKEMKSIAIKLREDGYSTLQIPKILLKDYNFKIGDSTIALWTKDCSKAQEIRDREVKIPEMKPIAIKLREEGYNCPQIANIKINRNTIGEWTIPQ